MHDSDELIYVVAGEITVSADGAEFTLAAGDTYYCVAGVRHRWWAHSAETTTLVFAVADDRTVRRRKTR